LLQAAVSGYVLRASIPYIKQDIPIMIVFKALGFVADKEILEHIVYDLKDKQVRPCVGLQPRKSTLLCRCSRCCVLPLRRPSSFRAET